MRKGRRLGSVARWASVLVLPFVSSSCVPPDYASLQNRVDQLESRQIELLMQRLEHLERSQEEILDLLGSEQHEKYSSEGAPPAILSGDPTTEP